MIVAAFRSLKTMLDVNAVVRRNTLKRELRALAILPLFAVACASAEPAAAPVKLVVEEPDTVVVDPKTEEVIQGALKYLSAQQAPNGSWSGNGNQHPIAMTGYALMAYMACGNLPTGGQYSRAVANGVQFLVASGREDGTFDPHGNGEHYMYDHGVATIALGELYGQTQDPLIKAKLSAAIKLIINSQSTMGGWRYNPRPEDADISVTVLQVVALRCAKNDGLDVPQSTIDHAVHFVRSCYDEQSGGFTYQPKNHAPGFARTAAAIYSLQVCGIYKDPSIATGSDYLLKSNFKEEEFFSYGHFYAAPAEYMIGGETWKKWYAGISDRVLKQVRTVERDPSLKYWEGIDGNARGVGPVYPTAIYTTILALPYHYIPLYQR
jgi:hypothetical protein